MRVVRQMIPHRSDFSAIARLAVPVAFVQVGLIFMGGGVNDVPFGDGKLCVSPGPTTFCRFGIQNSGSLGVLVEGPGIVAESQGFIPDCRIECGQTWYFQAWFRDPHTHHACSNFFNTTNGMEVTFVP